MKNQKTINLLKNLISKLSNIAEKTQYNIDIEKTANTTKKIFVTNSLRPSVSNYLNEYILVKRDKLVTNGAAGIDVIYKYVPNLVIVKLM